MKTILLNIFLCFPVVFGIVSIIVGHIHYSKAKKTVDENGKSFLSMQIVAGIQAASGYLLVFIYALVFYLLISAN